MKNQEQKVDIVVRLLGLDEGSKRIDDFQIKSGAGGPPGGWVLSNGDIDLQGCKHGARITFLIQNEIKGVEWDFPDDAADLFWACAGRNSCPTSSKLDDEFKIEGKDKKNGMTITVKDKNKKFGPFSYAINLKKSGTSNVYLLDPVIVNTGEGGPLHGGGFDDCFRVAAGVAAGAAFLVGLKWLVDRNKDGRF